MSNLSKLRAIGRQIEQDNRQLVADEAGSYRPAFWRNPLQRFGNWLAELIPAVRRERATANADFLKLVRKYRPQITAQYRECAVQFERWEEDNRRYGCGSGDASKRESEARAMAVQLTDELQALLAAKGWPYRNLVTATQLVHVYDGYLRMDAVWIYWHEIEEFLLRRSTL